jgi:lipopolysaccharide export system protein LptA
MPRPAILLALAALFFAGPIGAEPLDAAGEPLQMSADRLELDVEAKTAALTGHVKLTRGAMTVSCPRVDVRYDQVPHVIWAKGSGGVVAEVKGVRAEAKDLEIDLKARSMELRGGVRLTRGEGWITAEQASINIATGRVTLSEVKGSIPVPSPAP